MIVDADKPWLVARAAADSDAEAIHFGDGCVSWTGLAARAVAVAAQLRARGVVRGDIVAVQMAPHPRMVAMLHALQMLGAAMLPLNLRLAEPEIERILAHATPRLLVTDDDPVAGAATKSFAVPSRIDPHAALTIVYTSGTTAVPKGVVLTNASYASAAAASRLRLGHGAGDVWMAALPLFHVGGLAVLARSVLEGSRVILEAGFDAARIAAVIESGDATMIPVVPTMLARVLDCRKTAPSSRVRCVLVGGAALAPALARRALDAGLPISATWGMTETCSQICSSAPGSDDAARGLVGRPLDGTDVKIAGADAEGWGELLVKGPTVMQGYLRNADANRSALRDGWLYTGDIGRIEESGSVAVACRRGDLIVTGGENVSPLEVEQVLDEHPGVNESLVAGVADAEWGQRVVADIVACGSPPPSAATLTAWCRERIAAYKTPREFRFVESLPRGATGKLLRRNE